MESTIRVNELHVSYYGKEILHDVNFEMETGRLIGIIGPNGWGSRL